MLEKIKLFAETVRAVLLYLLTPLVFIGALFFEVTKLNKEVNEKKDRDEAGQRAKAAQDAAKVAMKEGEDAEEHYARLRDEYLHPGVRGGLQPSDSSVRSSDPKEERSDN